LGQHHPDIGERRIKMRLCSCGIEVPDSLNIKGFSSYGLTFKLNDRVALNRRGREYHIEQINLNGKIIIANQTRTVVKCVQIDELYLIVSQVSQV